MLGTSSLHMAPTCHVSEQSRRWGAGQPGEWSAHRKTIKSQEGTSWSRECRSEQQGGCRAARSDKEASNSQESTEQSRMCSSNEVRVGYRATNGGQSDLWGSEQRKSSDFSGGRRAAILWMDLESSLYFYAFIVNMAYLAPY